MTLAVLAALADTNGSRDEIQLSGACRYNQAVTDHRDQAVLAICDTLAIDRDREAGKFDFGQQSWGSMMQFIGQIEGNKMNVTHVALRSGDPLKASGKCEIFYANERISVVSCLAKAGTKYYAANFEVSRF